MADKQFLSLITFDIDDTLYSSNDFAHMARENALKAMIDLGLKIDLPSAIIELDQVVSEFSSNDEHHFDRLLQRLPLESICGINTAIFVAAGVVAYRNTVHNGLVLYEDALECLKRLQAQNFPLGIISQGWPIKQAEKLVRLKILPYLNKRAIFFSDQMGASKSNPKCYTRIAQLFGAPPKQCMHIGDRPDRDITPANEAGWITVHNCRAGRYHQQAYITPPAYTVHNFWDLLDIIEKKFQPSPSN